MLRALIALLMLAGQAAAGAWPRETGATFLSVAALVEAPEPGQDPTGYVSVYAEHGLGRRLTAGLDLGSDEAGTKKAIAFLRVPLSAPDHTLKLAAELGAGSLGGEAVLRPGLSLGRGLTLFGRQGWVALDARGEITPDATMTDVAGEVTLGLSTGPRTKAIVQLQGGASAFEDTFLRLAPSIVREHAPGRHIELGVTAGLRDTADYGLRIGLWREF